MLAAAGFRRASGRPGARPRRDHGLRADPRLRTPGRVIGLVDQFTDSSATMDAQSLKKTGAVLMGQPPADPLDEWGNERTFRLPRSGLVI